MFTPDAVRRAVDLQQRSYQLLRWTADAVERGFIAFERAHEYSSLPDAAEAWITQHYENLPPETRPAREDLGDFARLFSTYLDSSFEMRSDPEMQLYSPNAHCFCPICSWLVRAPRLKTRKVASADKRRAHKLRVEAVQQIALDAGKPISAAQAEAIAGDPAHRESTSLAAYARDLERRMQGYSEGPAALALWRGFAWTAEGSPRKGFELSAGLILDAEASLRTLALGTA